MRRFASSKAAPQMRNAVSVASSETRAVVESNGGNSSTVAAAAVARRSVSTRRESEYVPSSSIVPCRRNSGAGPATTRPSTRHSSVSIGECQSVNVPVRESTSSSSASGRM